MVLYSSLRNVCICSGLSSIGTPTEQTYVDLEPIVSKKMQCFWCPWCDEMESVCHVRCMVHTTFKTSGTITLVLRRHVVDVKS
jgi:hypothetical protein